MSLTPPIANFDRAEFHGDPPPPDSCAYCHQPIATQYFRVDGNLACPACAEHAQSLIPPDSHKAYSRAVLFGIGAAIATCAAYSAVQMLHFMIGFIAIGVGWVIGTAMKKGSRGLGGRRYQITAAMLTYTAIAMSFIPVFIWRDLPEYKAAHPTESVQSSSASPAAPAKSTPPSFGKFALGVIMLFGAGLVSPILKFFIYGLGSSLLNLLFLFIGIQTAWKLTERAASEVDGPYDQTPSRLSTL